jgi:hypothetical protein
LPNTKAINSTAISSNISSLRNSLTPSKSKRNGGGNQFTTGSVNTAQNSGVYHSDHTNTAVNQQVNTPTSNSITTPVKLNPPGISQASSLQVNAGFNENQQINLSTTSGSHHSNHSNRNSVGNLQSYSTAISSISSSQPTTPNSKHNSQAFQRNNRSLSPSSPTAQMIEQAFTVTVSPDDLNNCNNNNKFSNRIEKEKVNEKKEGNEADDVEVKTKSPKKRMLKLSSGNSDNSNNNDGSNSFKKKDSGGAHHQEDKGGLTDSSSKNRTVKKKGKRKSVKIQGNVSSVGLANNSSKKKS